MNHTPEPWHGKPNCSAIWDANENLIAESTKKGRSGSRSVQLANAERIVECVNALAGIEDPAGFMQGIFNALREIERETGRLAAEDEYKDSHERRIRQLTRAALQSMSDVEYLWKVQRPALSPEQP